MPASLVAYQLARPLTILPINYRDPENNPRYEQPRLLEDITLTAENQRLLLVDDVSVSGKTLALAKELLSDQHITTLMMKGQADIVLFPVMSNTNRTASLMLCFPGPDKLLKARSFATLQKNLSISRILSLDDTQIGLLNGNIFTERLLGRGHRKFTQPNRSAPNP